MKGPLWGITPELAVKGHVVWVEIAPQDGKPGFRPEEFNNPYDMDAHFLRWLHRVRQDTGPVPLRPISDHRTSDIGATRSAHKSRPCRSVDLQVYNAYERGAITVAAIRHGCVRWGTYPGKVTGKGKDQSGLHLDASEEPHHGAPANWTRYD